MTDLRRELYATREMVEAFSAETWVGGMLAFEAALARAEARANIIPAEAAEAITAACTIDAIDVPALLREASRAGTPAIPLVRMLTEIVPPVGRAYVHWGATSQDAVDTATVLQMRHGFMLLESDLHRLGDAASRLASDHRYTLMPGRTLLQQALPITFGLKAARWLALVTRRISVLQEQRAALALQFGGAAGTLAALGDRGWEVAALLAEELDLCLPDLPWHAERDRMANAAAALGVTAGAMAKIAQDIVLLAQTEVAEVSERHVPGKGGSSTLPHKHNPVDATMAVAAAELAIGQVPILLGAMVQEHERGVGGWQAEWESLPNLFLYTSGTVGRTADVLDGLQVDPGRMNAHLEGGLLMAEALSTALAHHVGRPEAQRLTRQTTTRATETGRTLQQTALDDTEIRRVLLPDEIGRALDPARYLGNTDILIDRALQGYAALKP